MKPLDIIRRQLELTQPTERNAWSLLETTATDLESIITTETAYNEYAELESKYQTFAATGIWEE